MSPEITAALIAAVVSTVGGGTIILIQLTIARRERLSRERREELDRHREAEAIRSRYRDPLLASAWALQSRIYNIVAKDLFSQPAENKPRFGGRSYAVESTLYVLGEFLGWIEILRREVQFMDLGDDEQTRRINRVLYGIRDLLAQNDPRLGSALRLFRTEQRAVGELMIEAIAAVGETRYQCIGPATFATRLNEPHFQRWFGSIEDNLRELADGGHEGALVRLALIQNWILVFMELLDPRAVNLAGSRHALPIPPEFEQFTPARRLAKEMPGEPIALTRPRLEASTAVVGAPLAIPAPRDPSTPDLR